jgi:hypothetical protein
MATTQLPEEQIKFTFENETYQVKYPTNGQVMDIEANKVSLSSGKYLDWLRMAAGGAVSSINALNVCDMIATVSVLIPTLRKRLRVNSLIDLTPIQTRKLSKEFAKTILPWLESWDEALNAAEDEDEGGSGDEAGE